MGGDVVIVVCECGDVVIIVDGGDDCGWWEWVVRLGGDARWWWSWVVVVLVVVACHGDVAVEIDF